jgi:Family of unknown function (DUF5681)
MAEDSEVGYGRPPKHSQFKPGKSGNPKGRRPQFGNFEADLLEELNAEISIRDKGVERKISKQRAIVNTLVAAAIAGNMRASVALLGIFARSSVARADADPETKSGEDDDKLLQRFESRQRQRESAKGAKKTSSGSLRNEG